MSDTSMLDEINTTRLLLAEWRDAREAILLVEWRDPDVAKANQHLWTRLGHAESALMVHARAAAGHKQGESL